MKIEQILINTILKCNQSLLLINIII